MSRATSARSTSRNPARRAPDFDLTDAQDGVERRQNGVNVGDRRLQRRGGLRARRFASELPLESLRHARQRPAQVVGDRGADRLVRFEQRLDAVEHAD